MPQAPQPTIQETYIMINAFTPHASPNWVLLEHPALHATCLYTTRFTGTVRGVAHCNSTRQDPHAQGLAMDLVRYPDLGLSAIDVGDAVQAGELVNAFWTVFILDKLWAVALGASSSITDHISGVPISTPWPLSMEAYEEVRISRADADRESDRHAGSIQGQRATSAGNNTSPVSSVLADASTADDLAGSTPLTLRAKACILFFRASLLAAQYQNEMPHANLFWSQFNTLDNLINAFIANFPPIPVLSRDTSERLVASTIARVATVQLHVRFVGEQARSRQRCLIAASAIVTSIRDVRSNDLGFIDPIMAILLSSAGQVIISEMKATGTAPTIVTGPEQSAGHADSLNQILAVMADFGPICPLMGWSSSLMLMENGLTNRSSLPSISGRRN
ncbi:hypothetical protein NM688_g927 [Phlebia brevispora]|uniref:Uncharacterized protein n=1 Tax=Phlebia brevispora TaxID=194682 RepID=A0ACC1TCS8_9APHY|nr:hypothetical protein NM688_g927 [Phlebia brevispora]